MNVRDWLTDATNRIEKASLSCADPKLHAQQILEAAYGWTAAKVLTHGEQDLSSEAIATLEAFLKRRLLGEPFQYILGREYFWKDEFAVGPGVLIPRRETEHVVEFLASLDFTHAQVIELGAGSGNIGISTLREKPKWNWYAAEKNAAAFEFARRNALRCLGNQAVEVLEARGRSQSSGTGMYFLFQGDFFDLAESFEPASFHVVVSNPPYIATGEITTLSREVRSEPVSALDGGSDGLDFIRRLARQARRLLKSEGWLVLEIGSDQEDSGLEIFTALGYEEVSVVKDLAGLARVVVGKIR